MSSTSSPLADTVAAARTKVDDLRKLATDSSSPIAKAIFETQADPRPLASPAMGFRESEFDRRSRRRRLLRDLKCGSPSEASFAAGRGCGGRLAFAAQWCALLARPARRAVAIFADERAAP
jgi:hypothetical protein